MVIKIIRVIVPVLVLCLGVIGTMTLMGNKKGPLMRPPMNKKITPMVETTSARKHVGDIEIETYGITKAAASLSITPEVGGRVTWINDDLKDGKKIQKGARLIEIDPTEYKLKVQQANATLIEARYNLDLAKARQAAAIEEYESYQKLMSSQKQTVNQQEKMSRLAKYEPQVEAAIGTLESAKAGLALAKLNLRRTIITAPMDGYLSSTRVTEGQLISANESVATLSKSNPIILEAPVSLSDTQWLIVEEEMDGSVGSPAVVSKRIGSISHQWTGVVKRRLREISDSGRKAIMIIEVENTRSNNAMELPIGLFVDVSIKGSSEKDYIEIPVDAIREDNTVWTVNSESQLEIKRVMIDKQTDSMAYVSSGLSLGDNLITSSLTAPIPGMDIKILNPVPSLANQENRVPGKQPSGNSPNKSTLNHQTVMTDREKSGRVDPL